MNKYNTLIPENEFQTAIPSNDGTLTFRTLNTLSPSNNNLLVSYNIIPVQTIPINSYNRGTCLANMSQDAIINTKEDLFMYLCDVLIRFDTNPNYYQKEDYEALLRMLVGSLLHFYDVYAHPTPYKITESPYILTDIIPIGHLVKSIMVYNNEDIPITLSLGYTNLGEEILSQETIDSKTWRTISMDRLISISDPTSLYFSCVEDLSSNGIYVVVDSSFYFST